MSFLLNDSSQFHRSLLKAGATSDSFHYLGNSFLFQTQLAFYGFHNAAFDEEVIKLTVENTPNLVANLARLRQLHMFTCT
jgi:hypothetical protein